MHLWCLPQSLRVFPMCMSVFGGATCVHTQALATWPEIEGIEMRDEASKTHPKPLPILFSQPAASSSECKWFLLAKMSTGGDSFSPSSSSFVLLLPLPTEQQRLGHYNLSTGRMRNADSVAVAAAEAITKQLNWQKEPRMKRKPSLQSEN